MGSSCGVIIFNLGRELARAPLCLPPMLAGTEWGRDCRKSLSWVGSLAPYQLAPIKSPFD